MSSLDNAKSSLSQLSDILNQFKSPSILDSEFSKLQSGVSKAQTTLNTLDPNASEDFILTEVEKVFDSTLTRVSYVDKIGENLKFDLPFKTTFDNGLPNFITTIDSTFSLDNPLPNLTFKVGLDTGSFVQNFTQPVFGEIEKIISPLKPIEDALTANLPGLDQIGIPINLLGIAKTFAPSEASALITFFDAVDQVSSLVDAVYKLPANGNIVDLGEFTLNKDGGIGNSSPPVNIGDRLDPSITSFLNKAKNIPGGGLTFPLLEDPSTAFGLLLGKDVNLLNFTIPEVKTFKAEYSAPPIVIPIPPIPIPLVGQLSGGVTLGTSGLRFGYDTYGLKQNNPLQ
ncbi:MAG: hypothetical protein WCA35_07135, partial [Kovacikia sp.]